ncbi:phosphoglycerate mutase family protein [Bacteroidota bacterium]
MQSVINTGIQTSRTYKSYSRIFFSICLGFLILLSNNCLAQNNDKTKDKLITTIFLVRHAEKENDGSRDPELNKKGEERADKLCEMLIKSEITAIYSTNYKRTKNTAAPLAKKTDIEIQIYKPNDKSVIKDIIDKNKGSNILIVGHSNTIPKLVNQLINKEKYVDLTDDEYNKLFVVSLTENGSKCFVQQF